jgi:hypothetical protein
VAVPPDKIVRELRSSSTTGQAASRIMIDKTTAFRKSRALVAVLKEHLGPERRPLLVLDVPESVAPGETLSARGAAIRGIGNFASQTTFGLASLKGTPVKGTVPFSSDENRDSPQDENRDSPRVLPSADVEADWEAVTDFFRRHAERPLLVFGFTFLVWSRFLVEAQRRGLQFHAPQAVLLHSGGWKKLAAQSVTKDDFNRRAAEVLGCGPAGVLDFYGMVEQVGTVFVDCPAGNKHAPAFADVLIRRSYDLRPVAPGETGIIEVVSVLPTSYPGQAILTEDQGRLLGVDDCPCGRRGTYFRFTRRIEQAEIRGCGDTFAQSREIR